MIHFEIYLYKINKDYLNILVLILWEYLITLNGKVIFKILIYNFIL